MSKSRVTFWIVLVVLPGAGLEAGQEIRYGSVRNGGFARRRTLRRDDPSLAGVAKAKWTLPEDLVLPQDWGPNVNTPGGALEYVRRGGWMDSAFVRLDGGGHIASFYGRTRPGVPYIASLRVRGQGEIWFGAYEFGEKGQVGGATFVRRAVSTGKWTEYRGLYGNTDDRVRSVNLALAGKGPVDVDEVRFAPAAPADAEITREMMALYGTGALIEDPDVQAVRVDDAYRARLAEYDAALVEFRRSRAGDDKAVFESFEKKASALEPYLRGEGKRSVLSIRHNEMVALTRALRRMAGGTLGPAKAVTVEPFASGVGYKPGQREPRPDAVTVTDVRSDKVRYDENEPAATVATIVNRTGQSSRVTLIATMIVGLDHQREIARTTRVLKQGDNAWRFRYRVGPETYGRAIEVQCLDEKDEVLDRWQEYYAVASEWFRVQQHCGQAALKSYRTDPWVTYYNQVHNFASEPTDWGVQVDRVRDLEQYLSAQALYHLNMQARRAAYVHYRRMGVMGTFYQTSFHAGQMGYEVIREHPEFCLYDANGQFAVDPVYGSHPNPMELSSPIEIGPKRPATKPYLDRKLTSWQHGVVNFAREDAVRYMAERIREHAKFLNCDGIYVDGNVGVWSGYGHEGKPNLPLGTPEEVMELNARNHRLFSEIVKKDNPDFGIWYNWSYRSHEYSSRAHGGKNFVGSGGPGDVGDATIRAASVRNSMFLLEIQDTFRKTESKWTSPAYHLDMLCNNRDAMMQRYGANMIVGYQFPWPKPEDPGANRWGWTTLSCFGAQLIAAQHHFAGGFVPSMRPWLQFMTRYSRYLWAPDVKVVARPQEIVDVDSPEEVWWKRLVYRLPTDDGYDLIVHLVRVPPTPKWDVDWLDEPRPLAAVTVRASLGEDELRDAWAVRPYDYEEAQQTVQTSLPARVSKGAAEVTVPPFRYHTMVVLRVNAR